MASHAPRFTAAESRLPTCPHCRDIHERDEYGRHQEGEAVAFTCPTCGRQFRPTDRLSVFHELFDVLSMHRRGTHIDRMAAALLRAERGTRELVGLSADATRALFVNTESRTLVAVAFDKHGISATVDEVLSREVRDAGSWLESREGLLWSHPRYE